MCLFPKLIRNRKYTVNKKNGGEVPNIKDYRTLFVPVGCGKCMECKNKKGNEWKIRLQEEIKETTNGKFVTMTFSNESIRDLAREINIEPGYDLDNEIATLAVRRFLERWRKKYGTSIKHWLVTELGQGKQAKWQGTENLHLHGILFTDNTEDIRPIWKYGHVYIGKYVNNATINYSVKYFTKTDPLHKAYTAKILTSKGIGQRYTTTVSANSNFYKSGNTNETYRLATGAKTALPTYYRNKLYTEEQREQLWLNKLDNETRYVLGRKISTKDGPEEYYKALARAQAKNKRMGFGDDSVNWNRVEYENERRKINIQKRIDKANENDNFET